jgi:hypothetical protein
MIPSEMEMVPGLIAGKLPEQDLFFLFLLYPWAGGKTIVFMNALPKGLIGLLLQLYKKNVWSLQVMNSVQELCTQGE